MFFDVFQQAEQESEVKSQKKWLVAEISDLLSLFVRDCSTKVLCPEGSAGVYAGILTGVAVVGQDPGKSC